MVTAGVGGGLSKLGRPGASAELAPCHLDLSRLITMGLKQYCNNASLSDLVLIAPDGRGLHCHSVILAAASRRFAAALQQGSWQHGQQMPVKGVDSDALERLVSSFYTGECPLDLSCAAAVYDAAVKLEVPALPTALEQYLSQALLPRNVCAVMETCLRAGTSPLVQLCNDFIRCRLADVLTAGDFPSANLEVAACVCKDLAQHSQLIALQAAVTWLSSPGRSHLAGMLAAETGLSLEAMQAVLVNGGAIMGAGGLSNSLLSGSNASNAGGGGVLSDSGGPLIKQVPIRTGGQSAGQANVVQPVLQLLGPGGRRSSNSGGAGGGGGASTQQQTAVLLLPGSGSDGRQPAMVLTNGGPGAGLGLDALAAAAEGERLSKGPGGRGAAAAVDLVGGGGNADGGGGGGSSNAARQAAPKLLAASRPAPPQDEGGAGPDGLDGTEGGEDEVLDDDPDAPPSGGGGGSGGGGRISGGGAARSGLPGNTPVLLTGRRAPSQKGTCHVQGCNRSLAGLRDYYQRYKICEYHLKVRSVLKDGVAHRFCQQCGRFHPLTEFDGERRSCRTMLQRHCHRRAKQKQELAEVLAQRIAEKEAAAAIMAAAASGTLGVGGGLPLHQLQYLAGAAAVVGSPLGQGSVGTAELGALGLGGGSGDGSGAGGSHQGGRNRRGTAVDLLGGGVTGLPGSGRLRGHSPPSKAQLIEAVMKQRQAQQPLLSSLTPEQIAQLLQQPGAAAALGLEDVDMGAAQLSQPYKRRRLVVPGSGGGAREDDEDDQDPHGAPLGAGRDRQGGGRSGTPDRDDPDGDLGSEDGGRMGRHDSGGGSGDAGARRGYERHGGTPSERFVYDDERQRHPAAGQQDAMRGGGIDDDGGQETESLDGEHDM